MMEVFSRKFILACGWLVLISAHSSVAAPMTAANKSSVSNRQMLPSQNNAQTSRPLLTAPVAAPAYRAPASSHDISEAIDITGQSRNLSMGLMFQRDQDKVSFGLPRTNYKDKISGSQINY